LLGQPRPPRCLDQIARLQGGAVGLAGAAGNHAGMAAMVAGQQRGDDAGLAQATNRQNDAVIGPFHQTKLHMTKPAPAAARIMPKAASGTAQRSTGGGFSKASWLQAPERMRCCSTITRAKVPSQINPMPMARKLMDGNSPAALDQASKSRPISL
jgi:hypothetical protein